MIISRSTHVAISGIVSFFLWLNSILLYIYIYRHTDTQTHTHTHTHIYTHTHHIFLIYLSIDGHLDYFHVLAIVSTAAMNTGVHVSF